MSQRDAAKRGGGLVEDGLGEALLFGVAEFLEGFGEVGGDFGEEFGADGVEVVGEVAAVADEHFHVEGLAFHAGEDDEEFGAGVNVDALDETEAEHGDVFGEEGEGMDDAAVDEASGLDFGLDLHAGGAAFFGATGEPVGTEVFDGLG